LRVLLGFAQYGAWALRDATPLLESFFIILGFLLVSQRRGFRLFTKWLPRLLFITAIYSLGYPFKAWLANWVPMIQSAAGAPIPILFTYVSKYMILLFLASYLFIFTRYSITLKKAQLRLSGLYKQLLMAFLVAFSVVFFQARTVYFQLVCLIGFYLTFEPQKTAKIYTTAGLLLLALFILPFTGVELQGRLGTVSVDFFANHFLSSFGFSTEGMEGAAGGVDLRFSWWTQIFSQLLSSVQNFLFGLGYGIPLTDFSTTVQVREPHNSFLSVLARLGLLGFLSFVWMHIVFVRAWFKAYKSAVLLEWLFTRQHLLWMMSYCILMWVFSMGEDGFEKPFFAIPYYFFWGVMLGMFYYIQKAASHKSPTNEYNAYP
jgi:O-antigen ligase